MLMKLISLDHWSEYPVLLSLYNKQVFVIDFLYARGPNILLQQQETQQDSLSDC